MDGISSAAGVVAVASIAPRLADNIHKLATFWNSIKDAPADIRSIAIELDLLASILAEIAAEAQHVEPDASLVAALQNCESKVITLTSIIDSIECGFASGSLTTKKWTALKAAFRFEKLEKFQDFLERLKSNLILVQQKQQSRLIRHGFRAQRQDLMLITQSASALAVDRPFGSLLAVAATPTDFHESTDAEVPIITRVSPDVSRRSLWTKKNIASDNILIKCGFGTITGDWKQLVLQPAGSDDQIPDQQETRYSYSFVPAEWFRSLGFNRRFYVSISSSSISGWQHTLQTARIVPDESLIFAFCEQGNLDGVRSLFTRGDASVKDVNSMGYTPLFFAAQFHKAELCSYLISCGADRCATSRSDKPHTFAHLFGCEFSPLSIAASSSHDSTCKSEVLDTLRLFVDLLDFSDKEDLSSWKVILLIIAKFTGNCARIAPVGQQKVVLWLLEILASDIQGTGFWDSEALVMCRFLIRTGCLSALDYVLHVAPANALDMARSRDGYAIIHLAVLSTRYSISPLLAKDINLHALSLVEFHSHKPDSPTSLAMYNYWTFKRWFQALLNAGKDVGLLIDQETREGPVFDAGWKSSTLRLLFNADVLELFFDAGCETGSAEDKNCRNCQQQLMMIIAVQPYWLTMLEAIKTGTPPKQWLEKERRKNGLPAEQRPEPVQGEWKRADAKYSEGLQTSLNDGTESMTGFDEDQRSFEINTFLCLKCWEHF